MAGRNKIYNEEEALDKAIQVFWEKGYDNASSRDLQKAMGIGFSSFYLAYKGGKHELFLKSMKRFADVYPAEPLLMLKKVDNPMETIRQYFYVMADPEGLFGKFGCYFSNSIIQVADEQLKSSAIAHINNIVDAFSESLDRAEKGGFINPTVPKELRKDYLLNLWAGLNATKYVEKDVSRLKAVIDFSLKVFE